MPSSKCTEPVNSQRQPVFYLNATIPRLRGPQSGKSSGTGATRAGRQKIRETSRVNCFKKLTFESSIWMWCGFWIRRKLKKFELWMRWKLEVRFKVCNKIKCKFRGIAGTLSYKLFYPIVHSLSSNDAYLYLSYFNRRSNLLK